jgi:hypothetical protein
MLIQREVSPMKNLTSNISSLISSRLVLTAGALVSLAALPLNAHAQIMGGYLRPGAVPAQGQAVQSPAPVQMRPGPIVRGELPVYRSAPVYNAPVYNPPVYSRPVFGSGPGYGRGGTTYYNNGSNGYNNGNGYRDNGYNDGNYSGTGPVVTLPEAPYSPNRGGVYGDGSYGGGAFLPPVGPANGFFHNPIPPVGPANGYFSGQAPITGGGPALLGGYYYGNYCSNYAANSYPSLYSGYAGFPQYIYSNNVTVVGSPDPPDYATPYLPFYTPVYQTTYNQTSYYVATPERVNELQAGGEQAKAALEHAYPANSFQAAFADIAHAWTDGNIDLVRSHLRNPDTRISVFLDGKYSYSIASSDFSQITRDALDRLHTVSFNFTRLRKAKNGDVIAFGSHVYRASDTSDTGSDTGTVPFDQSGIDSSADGTVQGAEKTVYVSYTLRRFGSEWDIIATDSANHDLAASSSKAAE